MGALFEPWLATRDVQRSSRRNDRAVFSAYVAPRFGSAPVGSVTGPAVREWMASLRTKNGAAAPRTKRDALRVLRAILDFAMEDGRIARNPAVGIRVAGTKGSPGQALSLPELREFVAALRPPHHEVALVLSLAGLRWSELAGLDERDLVRDSDGRPFLAVRRRRVLDEEGKRVMLPGTKAGREMTRLVPLLPEVAAIVERRITGDPYQALFRRSRVGGSTRGTGGGRQGGSRRAGWSIAQVSGRTICAIRPRRPGCG